MPWPALRRFAIHPVSTRGTPRLRHSPARRTASARSSAPGFEDRRSRSPGGSAFRSRPARPSRNLPRFEKVRRKPDGAPLGLPPIREWCRRSGECRQPRSGGWTRTSRPNEKHTPRMFCLRPALAPGGSLPSCPQCGDADVPSAPLHGRRAQDPAQEPRVIREWRTRFSAGGFRFGRHRSRVSPDRGRHRNHEPRFRV